MNATKRFCENCGTALDASERFCGGCGQPTDGSSAAPQPMMSTPMAAANAGARGGWHAPTWVWLVVGLLFATGLTGGLYYVFSSASPKQPVLTAAQQDSIARHVLDDLPDRDAVDLDKATNPTDLPPDLQKKYDNSSLSAAHEAAMAEALGPLPKIDGELVSTKGKPSVVDDFSNPASGWRVATDAKAVREYADGALQIVFNAARGSAQVMAGRSVGNFAMVIEATPVSSPPNFWYGVVVRQSSGEKFVVFMINTQGMYAVSRREDGKSTAVVAPTKSIAIKAGMVKNVIKVEVVDDYFVFEVNGQTVEVQQIAGFGPGDVGVIVVRSPNDAPDPTKVTFDNFKLWVVR